MSLAVDDFAPAIPRSLPAALPLDSTRRPSSHRFAQDPTMPRSCGPSSRWPFRSPRGIAEASRPPINWHFADETATRSGLLLLPGLPLESLQAHHPWNGNHRRGIAIVDTVSLRSTGPRSSIATARPGASCRAFRLDATLAYYDAPIPLRHPSSSTKSSAARLLGVHTALHGGQIDPQLERMFERDRSGRRPRPTGTVQRLADRARYAALVRLPMRAHRRHRARDARHPSTRCWWTRKRSSKSRTRREHHETSATSSMLPPMRNTAGGRIAISCRSVIRSDRGRSGNLGSAAARTSLDNEFEEHIRR